LNRRHVFYMLKFVYDCLHFTAFWLVKFSSGKCWA